MPKYTPNTAPGQIRTRIWRIGGENPNAKEIEGAKPSMIFHEQEAIMLEGGVKERALGRTRDIPMAYDEAKNITIRNPHTDAAGAVGRIPADLTMAECLAVLYSLGRQAQTDKDAADAAEAAEAAARAAAAEAAEAAEAAAAQPPAE